MQAKWSGELPIDVDPRITLLSPTKDLTVEGISSLSPRQDDHVTEFVGRAVVLLLSQGNAKGLGWHAET